MKNSRCGLSPDVVRVWLENGLGFNSNKKSRERGLNRVGILAANNSIFNEVRCISVVVEGLFIRLYLAGRVEQIRTRL